MLEFLPLLRDWAEALGILFLILINIGRRIGRSELGRTPTNGGRIQSDITELKVSLAKIGERVDNASKRLSDLGGKLTTRDAEVFTRLNACLTTDEHSARCASIHQALDRHERAIENLEARQA